MPAPKKIKLFSFLFLVITAVAILVPLLVKQAKKDPFEKVSPVEMADLQQEYGSLDIFDHFLGKRISYFHGPRTAYLLMAHNIDTIKGLYELLKAVYRPYNLYVIHLDKKVREDLFQETKKKILELKEKDDQSFSGSNNIVFLEDSNQVNVKWGDWTIVQAELNLLAEAHKWNQDQTNPENRWQLAINLCGESYLMRSMAYIESSLAQALKKDTNLNSPSDFLWFGKMESLIGRDSNGKLVGDYYRTIAKLREDDKLDVTPSNGLIYKGSQWVVFPRAIVEDIYNFDDDQNHRYKSNDFTKWRKFMMNTEFEIPDESIFQTYVMNSNFSNYARKGADVDDYRSLDGPYTHIYIQWEACKTYENTRPGMSPCYIGVDDVYDNAAQMLNYTVRNWLHEGYKRWNWLYEGYKRWSYYMTVINRIFSLMTVIYQFSFCNQFLMVINYDL